MVAAAAFLLASVSGCVVHAVDPGSASSRNRAAPENAIPQSASRPVVRKTGWWKSFQDRELNAIVASALQSNPDLHAVARRIDQANSRLVQAGSTLFPRVDGSGSFDSKWNTDGSRTDQSSLGLSLNWEIDVWGRIRSGQAAREEEVRVAEEDWKAARLLLTGAVAEAWFELAEQRGQLKLAKEQIEANETLLDLIRLRFGQGQSSIVDVRQQQEQLQSTESLLPDIELRIGELELVLDTLTGNVPGSRKRIARSAAPKSPPAIPNAGYPSDLIENRPDLLARRAAIRALDHEVDEAIADCLPRFSIGGSAALAGTPGLESLVGNAIAGAVGPVFDAGNRKAEVRLRQSRVREELDLYTSDYLNAVREVETALLREQKITGRIQRQESQLETTRMLLAESRSQYSLGLTDYLPVLDALTKLQELERDLLTSRRERFSSRVLLHLALGGPVPLN